MRYFTFLFFLFAYQQSEPKSADPVPVPTEEDILSEVVEEGPVKATIEISPKEIRLGDPIQLKLSMYADKGVDIIPPPFGEALGRFQISNFTPRSVTKDDGSKEIIQTYTLQAPMSGIQRIPALRIVYTDNRNDTATEERELLTEEISLTINGLLEKDVAMDWKPARGTLVPKLNVPLWIRVVSAGGVLALVFTGFLFYRRRYISQQQAERVQSAYQKAIEDLMLLTQTDFGSNTDRFYAELSMIVRRYIEAKYGLHAP
ncbi:MAG: BatD family protein, partial [Myxococcota bacterium]|nr:BatD family protein [Myxococcota bacterium]